MADIHSLILKSDSTQIVSASKDLDNLTKSATGADNSSSDLTKTTDKTNTSMKEWGATVVGVTTGIYLLQKAISAGINSGFAYNNQLEEAKAGLIALSVAVQDKAIPVTERYARANIEATQTLKDLQEINVQTPHTLNETNKIYKAMFVSMKNVGAATEEMVELARSLSIASGAAGIEFNSLLTGVDGLASGTVLANSDLGRFLSSLGLTNEKLKESDDVVKLLTTTFEDFQAAETMNVALSNIDNSWSQLTGKMTADSFEGAKVGINELSGLINDLDEEDIQALSTSINGMAKASVESVAFMIKAFIGLQSTVTTAGTAVADVVLWLTEWDGDYDTMSKSLWATQNKALEANQKLVEGIEAATSATVRSISVSERKNNVTKEQVNDLVNLNKEIVKTVTLTKQQIEAQNDLDAMSLKIYQNFISAKKEAEEDLADWYENRWEKIQQNIEDNTITLSGVMQDSLRNVFDSDNYDFEDIPKALADSMLKESTRAMSTLATQYATIMSGNPVIGQLTGGLVGAGVSAVSSLFGGSGKSSEQKAEEAIEKFTKNLNEATTALENFGNFGTALNKSVTATEAEIKSKEAFIITQRQMLSDMAVLFGYDTGALLSDSKIRQAESEIEKLTVLLEDTITDTLSAALNYSLSTTSELQSIISGIDIDNAKELEMQLNRLAIEAKRTGTSLSDNSEALSIVRNENYTAYKDNIEAIEELSDRQQEAIRIENELTLSTELLNEAKKQELETYNDLITQWDQSDFTALDSLTESAKNFGTEVGLTLEEVNNNINQLLENARLDNSLADESLKNTKDAIQDEIDAQNLRKEFLNSPKNAFFTTQKMLDEADAEISKLNESLAELTGRDNFDLNAVSASIIDFGLANKSYVNSQKEATPTVQKMTDVEIELNKAREDSISNITNWQQRNETAEETARRLAIEIGVKLATSMGDLETLAVDLTASNNLLTDSEYALLKANENFITQRKKQEEQVQKELIEISMNAQKQMIQLEMDGYKTQTDTLNDHIQDISGNISTLQGTLSSLSDIIFDLKTNALGSSFGIDTYNKSMKETLALAGTSNYEAYAQSLSKTIKASSILNNEGAFETSKDMQFAQLVAAKQFEELEDSTLTQIDVLTQIEQNTKDTVSATLMMIEGLSTRVQRIENPVQTIGSKEFDPIDGTTLMKDEGLLRVNPTITNPPPENTTPTLRQQVVAGLPPNLSNEAVDYWVAQAQKTSLVDIGLATGTMNVPQDMPTTVHKGEIVVPETFSKGLRNGNMTMGDNSKLEAKLDIQNDMLHSVLNELSSQTSILEDSKDIQNGSLETLEIIEAVS